MAGTSQVTQCQKPALVGASGSYMVTAKLRVLAAAPVQASRICWLPLDQPKESAQ